MTTKPLFKAIVSGLVSGVVLYGLVAPLLATADVVNQNNASYKPTLVKNGHLTICKLDPEAYHVVKTIKMVVTGYSSTADQTDDTPFLTASQKQVEDGTIAINGLPFDTKIRIPKLFGDKVFTVQDRMNEKYGKLQRADVWFADTRDAVELGARYNVPIEILES